MMMARSVLCCLFLLFSACSKDEDTDVEPPAPIGDTDTDNPEDTGTPPIDQNGVYTGTVEISINNLGTGEVISCSNGTASLTVNKEAVPQLAGTMNCQIPDPTGTNDVPMSLEGMLQDETRADGTLWITFGVEPEEISWTGSLNELTLSGDVTGETTTPPWVEFVGAFTATKSGPLEEETDTADTSSGD
jgi:hypothetical protein